MRYTVVIPIHNLHRRGYDRLYWSLVSLGLQDLPPAQVLIMDSTPGTPPAWNSVPPSKLFKHCNVQHIPLDTSGEWNMPYLFNRGIELSIGEYIQCTGADFVYRRDHFSKIATMHASPDKFLLKEVQMLPPMDVTLDNVEKWNWPHRKRHPFGKGADGIQFAHRSAWYRIGGYDEQMKGFGGMDNDAHNRAKRAGLDCKWIPTGQILHIYHEQEKGRTREQVDQSKRNWKLRDDPNRQANVGCLDDKWRTEPAQNQSEIRKYTV